MFSGNVSVATTRPYGLALLLRLCLRPRVSVLVVRLRFKVGPICVSVFTRVQEFNPLLPRKEYITPFLSYSYG